MQSRVDFLYNLTPRSSSQRLPLINEFLIWIQFESTVLSIRQQLFMLPFIQLSLNHLNSVSADILKVLITVSTLTNALQRVLSLP